MEIITQGMLAPISSAVTGAIPDLVPVGVTIMAVMIGVSMIPRIIYKFF